MEKCYCPECKRKTNHEILANAKNSWSDEDEGYYLVHTYRLVQCCGGEHVSFNLECDGTEYEYCEPEGYLSARPEYFTFPQKENEIEPIEDN